MPRVAPNLTRRYTVKEVLAFPHDGKRYELLNGELVVSPAPTLKHQQVVTRLTGKLYSYLEALGLADTLFCSAADISWQNRQLFQPDVFVIDISEAKTEWKHVKTLHFVAEILSPSTALFDRNKKRPIYQTHHVDTLWLIDPGNQMVEVWTPKDHAPTIVTDVLTWQYAPDMPPVEIDVAWLLR